MKILSLGFLLNFLLQIGLIYGSSFTEPHDHQGVVTPFGMFISRVLFCMLLRNPKLTRFPQNRVILK